jgi:hypothetical protein
MVHAGPDLSHRRSDVCLLDARGHRSRLARYRRTAMACAGSRTAWSCATGPWQSQKWRVERWRCLQLTERRIERGVAERADEDRS